MSEIFKFVISTHSLTKRLTSCDILSYERRLISTHSLTKRLTFFFVLQRLHGYISTHSLTKRLTCTRTTARYILSISTHSLTKRLTGAGVIFLSAPINFNSQPHEEADTRPCESSGNTFISTHSLTKRLTAILDKNTFI